MRKSIMSAEEPGFLDRGRELCGAGYSVTNSAGLLAGSM